VEQAVLEVIKSDHAVANRLAELEIKQQELRHAQWNLDNTRVYAPVDGYLSNFIAREAQYVGILARMQMYTNEKYVLMRVNHQAIRNIKVGQMAEFTSAVYPGKIFSAAVEGIIEATGESQGSLLTRETDVRITTGKNLLPSWDS